MERLRIIRPDDWHLHVRDGDAMADAVVHSARDFGRAVIMPNLRPPVVSVALAAAYRQRILEALPEGSSLRPMMTIYLTDVTDPGEIAGATATDWLIGAKLYPAGATTNSDAGVTRLENIFPVLAAMEEAGLPLLVHGEVTDAAVDIFDREAVFIDRVLDPVVRRFEGLRVVFEHVSTAEAVAYVKAAPERVAATVTVHHLALDRNAVLAGGIRPHHYCLPVIKRAGHRRVLVDAVTSGLPRFFLGTDSAPHPRSAKEAACGCAGVFSAPVALPLLAEVFAAEDALGRLEAFTSVNGARFYGLPVNEQRITLVRSPWVVPATYRFGDDTVVPLRAGEEVAWRVEAGGSAESSE